jgi:hypothetical protein
MHHMKTYSLLLLAALASTGSAYGAAFTAGNLVVERVGNGSATLSSAAAAVSVIEFTSSGSSIQTLNLPTSGANQVTDSGSATSDGYLNSYNGYLGISGYNTASGTASVAALNTKVGTIFGSDGNVASRTAFPTGGPSGTPPSPFSGNNFRSVIPTGTSTFYATGTSSGTPNTGGAWYYDGSAFTQVSSTVTGQPTNFRNVEIYGGQLYATSGATTGYGIFSIGSGLPTASAQTSSLTINMGSGASPYGFVMFDTNADTTLDTAFIADDRTTAGGGLNKYTFDGSTWTNSYSLLVSSTGNVLTPIAGTGKQGIRGLAGSYDPVTGFTLYATTTETNNNQLIKIIDAGTNTPTSWTQLATAGTNNAFRGVDIITTAVPEPSTYAAILGGVALIGVAARRRRSV